MQLQALQERQDVTKSSVHISFGTIIENAWFPQCFLLVQQVSAPVVSLVAESVQSVHSVTADPE